MNLIITTKPEDFDFPDNFKINKSLKYCNNLVLIFNDESEIKKPDIKYNKLFVINNIPDKTNKERELLEYKVKEIINNYQFDNLNLFTHNKCHTWKNIFDIIKRELNNPDYFGYIKTLIVSIPINYNTILYMFNIILSLVIIIYWQYYMIEFNNMKLEIFKMNNDLKELRNNNNIITKLNDKYNNIAEENYGMKLPLDIIKNNNEEYLRNSEYIRQILKIIKEICLEIKYIINDIRICVNKIFNGIIKPVNPIILPRNKISSW